MQLFSDEVKDRKQLYEKIKDVKEIPDNYKIAVIVFAFDKDDKLILQRRGPKCRDERYKLEGIGGGVDPEDKDFRSALEREIKEEVGNRAVIEIDEFIIALGNRNLDIRTNKETYWILLAYKGTLKQGELEIKEPGKNLGFERYDLQHMLIQDLSNGALEFYNIIKERYGKEC